MQCTAETRTGRCPNASRWLVNARHREAQTSVCGVHLAQTVRELEAFSDSRYSRRTSDHGVMIYPDTP